MMILAQVLVGLFRNKNAAEPFARSEVIGVLHEEALLEPFRQPRWFLRIKSNRLLSPRWLFAMN